MGSCSSVSNGKQPAQESRPFVVPVKYPALVRPPPPLPVAVEQRREGEALVAVEEEGEAGECERPEGAEQARGPALNLSIGDGLVLEEKIKENDRVDNEEVDPDIVPWPEEKCVSPVKRAKKKKASGSGRRAKGKKAAKFVLPADVDAILEHASPPSPLHGSAAAEHVAAEDNVRRIAASPPPPPPFHIPLTPSIMPSTSSTTTTTATSTSSSTSSSSSSSSSSSLSYVSILPLPPSLPLPPPDRGVSDERAWGPECVPAAIFEEEHTERPCGVELGHERELACDRDNNNDKQPTMDRVVVREEKSEAKEGDISVAAGHMEEPWKAIEVEEEVEEIDIGEEQEGDEKANEGDEIEENAAAFEAKDSDEEEYDLSYGSDFEECVLQKSCSPSCIYVSGAKGQLDTIAHLIGVYFPVGQMAIGPKYRHVDVPTYWMLLEDFRWEITDVENDICLAYGVGLDQTSPFTVSEWKVIVNGHAVGCSMNAITYFPSLFLAGCDHVNAEHINGLYHQTSEIISGQPVYANTDGNYICFCVHALKWQIQPEAEKGAVTSYAYAEGPDNTSPFTTSLWKTFNGVDYVDSSLTSVCVFPSGCLARGVDRYGDLNGVYYQTGDIVGGRPSWKKSDGAFYICYLQEKHTWVVQNENQMGYLFAKPSDDHTSPFTVSCWRTFDGVRFKRTVVTFKYAFPSLIFTGVNGDFPAFLASEHFHQTSQVTGGRLAFRTENGAHWLCYSAVDRNWKVQSEEHEGLSICYAHSCGEDQTSPFTATSWRSVEAAEEALNPAITCVVSFPSIRVSGVDGSAQARVVNGVYHHTSELVCGRTAYKSIEGDTWICFDGRMWQIQAEANKGQPERYANALGTDPTSPFTVSEWQIYDGKDFVDTPIKCTSLACSIVFSGATGDISHHINGHTFHQTSRVVGFRPAYRNASGSLWCCYVPDVMRWCLQRSGEEGVPGGYLHSIGNDHTSPLTASGWKVATQGDYADSSVVCASSFPSLALSGVSGPWANKVNGTFYQTSELVCDRPVFCRDDDIWLCYSDTLCRWQVQSMEGRRTQSCYAFSRGLDQTSPFTVSEWNTHDQDSVTCVDTHPSLSVSGVVGKNGIFINGLFHQTAQMCCGRPVFRKTDDAPICIAYFSSGKRWQIQPLDDLHTEFAYAYALGPDQTSPLTVTEWKVTDVQGFVDSTLLIVHAFPSVCLSGGFGAVVGPINGVFHQTNEIVCGRPTFKSVDRTLMICFTNTCHGWEITDARGVLAFSIGDDQTSPHMVRAWKILVKKKPR